MDSSPVIPPIIENSAKEVEIKESYSYFRTSKYIAHIGLGILGLLSSELIMLENILSYSRQPILSIQLFTVGMVIFGITIQNAIIPGLKRKRLSIGINGIQLPYRYIDIKNENDSKFPSIFKYCLALLVLVLGVNGGVNGSNNRLFSMITIIGAWIMLLFIVGDSIYKIHRMNKIIAASCASVPQFLVKNQVASYFIPISDIKEIKVRKFDLLGHFILRNYTVVFNDGTLFEIEGEMLGIKNIDVNYYRFQILIDHLSQNKFSTVSK